MGKWCLHASFKWDLTLAHWTQVSDRCPLGYLFIIFLPAQDWEKYFYKINPAAVAFIDILIAA